MKLKRLCNILLGILSALAVYGHSADSIYMGTQLKFDIASPIIIPAANNWKIQNYEMAVNVRLAKRWYPTFELGYAGGYTAQRDTLTYTGHGGFFRVGCDLNPLKKHPERPHALLVGVRLGTAVQSKGYTDCWGEIVAGCQVEIAQVQNTSFYMGWMGRFKCLFTRNERYFNPEYISGYGKRDTIGWGVNYYLGWRF